METNFKKMKPYRSEKLTELRQIGNLTTNAKRDNPNRRRLYDPNGIAPCLSAGMGMGGNLVPLVMIHYEPIKF